MAYILYDNGTKLGEISGWTIAAHPAVFKNVLGKTVLSVPANDECTFVSPKPLNRRAQLRVVKDGKREFILDLKSVQNGTVVIAKIVQQRDVLKR